MKKYISYLLMLAMLISMVSIAAPIAFAADSVVAKFDSAEDLANWGYKYYGQSTPTEADLSTDYVRMGQYSLKISDVRHGGSRDATNYLKLQNLSVPINGAAYINIWLYSEPGDGAVTLRWAYASTQGRVSGTGVKKTLTGGWELISIPIAEAHRNDELTLVQYGTEGYGMPSSSEGYINTKLWINGVFLSDAIPTQPKITTSTITEGSQLVKNDIGKINLGAKAINLPADDKITITPDVSYHLETADGGDTLSIVFDEYLQYATNYTVSMGDGVYDIFGMEFEPYTLTFRTRGEFENIPPVAELTAPIDGERYIPSDEITLSAVATDENGTVEYVEFYCDGELIKGSRTTSDSDVYTFAWTTAQETLTNYKITAKAVDNEGAEIITDAVTIRVMEYKNPTVTLEKPKDNSLLYKSVGGVEGDTKLTVAAKTADIDTEVVSVDVYLNGEIIHTATEGLAEFSYTHETPLDEGVHTIKLVATDDMGLTGEAEAVVEVQSMGKSFPAVLTNDLTIAKWSISKETASISSTDDGLVITTEANDTARLGRTLRRNLSIAPWQADIVVVPQDTTHNITVGVAGSSEVSLLTFKNDGKTSSGKPYEAGKAYTISAVVNPENGKISCLLDGELVETKALTASVFSSKAELYVSHNGANAKTTVKSAEIFMLKNAAEFGELKLYKGGTEQDKASVPRTVDYMTVSLDGGLDTKTLDGNVKVTDKLSGKEVAVSVKEDKIYIDEILKSGKTYKVTIGSNVSNPAGQGLSGVYSEEFTAEKAPVDIKMSDDGTNLTVTVTNSTDAAVEAEIVVAVYNGKKAVLPFSITPVTLTVGESTQTVALPAAGADSVIEAFVVDSMDTMRPISDEIYIIKEG